MKIVRCDGNPHYQVVKCYLKFVSNLGARKHYQIFCYSIMFQTLFFLLNFLHITSILSRGLSHKPSKMGVR